MKLSTRKRAIKARAMKEEGYKMSRIEQEFGVTRQAIHRWFKELNEIKSLT